jgi:CHAT domain-containing protein/tetratricopeptide (TPR) repeat protein
MRSDIQAHIDQLNKQIVQLTEQQQYEEAIVLATSQLDFIRQNLGEQSTVFVESLNNLATLYSNIGEYDEAELFYIEALSIRRAALGEQHPDVATSLNNLATFYSSIGEFVRAESLYQQALLIRRTVLGEQHPDVAESLNDLATLNAEMGEYDEAEPFDQQALLNRQALLYAEMGEYRKAEPLFEQVLVTQRAALGEQHPDVAAILTILATLNAEMGEYDKAELFYKQALAISRAALGEQHPDVAMDLNALGALYHVMGEYRKAEPLYQQGLSIMRTVLGEQHPDVAMNLNALGALYHEMGTYDKAESLYQQALSIRRTVLGEQHPDVAMNLNALGALYAEMGEYRKAESLYQQALVTQRAVLGEQHPDVAVNLNNLAALYHDMGEYHEAEFFYQQALWIREAALGEQHPDMASSLNNLGALYLNRREYDKAEPLLEQALSIREAVLGDLHPDVASSLNDLAALYHDMGEYDKAKPLYQQALLIRRAVLGEQHPDVARSLGLLSLILVAIDHREEAFFSMQQELAIEDQMIGQIFSFGSDRRRMAFLATVRASLTFFLSLILQLFRSSPEHVQAAMDVVLRRKGLAAEAVAAQRDALLGGRYPMLATELELLTTLRSQIVQKTLAGPGAESIETHQQLLNAWNEQKERLEANLARQIPEMNLAQQLRQVNRHAIADRLPQDALLVEFVHFDVFDFHAIRARGEHPLKPAHYAAFVLPGSNPNQVQLIDLGEAEPIDRLIADFRLPLSGREGRDLLADEAASDEGKADMAGKHLREMIFDPLLPYLHGCRHLFLAPDGNLSRLPFEVLPTEDSRRLIDRYHISYVSVGRDLLSFTATNDRQAQAPVVMADPNFDFTASTSESSTEISVPGSKRAADLASHALTFKPLPGTRLEGHQVAQALGVHSLLDEQAKVSSLKALRSPRILHLATHGFFLPDQPRDPDKEFSSLASQQLGVMGSEEMAAPDRLTWLMGQRLENPLLRSGLAFAGANTWNRGEALPHEIEDGLLTAEDVSGLDLRDTELVVLSACETGLGTVHIGEGVFGLRRTFVLAGAKTLVMSLWKVPDQQTQELMEDFYRRLLAGRPRSEALREAQLALKEKYPHPYFWGAFICQGNPGPLT